MKPESVRLRWILRYLRERSYDSMSSTNGGPMVKARRSYQVSTLDAYFVDDYIEYTEAPFKGMILGAHRCDQLAADLKKLHDRGDLKRWACGVGGGMSGQGFPKWIWSYYLTNP
jgi:hypothetical protein